jgi:peptide/nickel transport system permease protein
MKTMVGYLVRRALQSILFVIISTFAIFTAVVYMPSGPADTYAITLRYDATDPTFKDDVPRVLVDYYEVDKPWPLSYFAWLFDPDKTMEMNENRQMVPVGIDITIGPWRLRGTGVLTGDFGRVGSLTSYDGKVQRGPTVTSQIEDSWGNSVLVVGLAVLFSLLVAIPLGIIASARPGGPLDRVVTFASSLSLSLPLYGLAYLLITFLAVLPYYLRTQVGWSWMPNLPSGGTHTDIDQQSNMIDNLYHAALPAITLAIPQIAIVSKYVRVSMLEVLGLDYIRTAWAKGLPKWRILAKHAFRNALLPTITVVGLVLPAIASGSIVVEYAFAYHGLGYLGFTALGGCVPSDDNPCTGGMGRPVDGAMLMALLLLLVAIIAVANVMADIMYMVADPRVEFSGHKSR